MGEEKVGATLLVHSSKVHKVIGERLFSFYALAGVFTCCIISRPFTFERSATSFIFLGCLLRCTFSFSTGYGYEFMASFSVNLAVLIAQRSVFRWHVSCARRFNKSKEVQREYKNIRTLTTMNLEHLETIVARCHLYLLYKLRNRKGLEQIGSPERFF